MNLTSGPIIYYRVYGKETILLNSGKVALDLLESRSSIYSDRPTAWMVGELAGRKRTVFLMSFLDPQFKTLRKLLQTGLNPRACKTYRPIQTESTQTFLRGLLGSPNDFATHIRRFALLSFMFIDNKLKLDLRNAISVILKVAYGYQVEDDNDPLLTLLEESFRLRSSLSIPGKYWIEFMPLRMFSWF